MDLVIRNEHNENVLDLEIEICAPSYDSVFFGPRIDVGLRFIGSVYFHYRYYFMSLKYIYNLDSKPYTFRVASLVQSCTKVILQNLDYSTDNPGFEYHNLDCENLEADPYRFSIHAVMVKKAYIPFRPVFYYKN